MKRRVGALWALSYRDKNSSTSIFKEEIPAARADNVLSSTMLSPLIDSVNRRTKEKQEKALALFAPRRFTSARSAGGYGNGN